MRTESGNSVNSEVNGPESGDANNDGGEIEETKKKKKLLDKAICSDLIVLGLPFKLDETELREYFLEFGDVAFCEVCFDSCTLFLSLKFFILFHS